MWGKNDTEEEERGKETIDGGNRLQEFSDYCCSEKKKKKKEKHQEGHDEAERLAESTWKSQTAETAQLLQHWIIQRARFAHWDPWSGRGSLCQDGSGRPILMSEALILWE